MYLYKLKTKSGDELIEHYHLDEHKRKKWSIDFYNRLQLKDLKPYILPNLDQDDIKAVQLNQKYFM